MPDKFFLSQQNPAVLLQWIQEIRAELLSLNTLTPENSNSIINSQSAKVFLANKISSFNYYTASKYEQTKQDDKAKLNKDFNSALSETYKDLGTIERGLIFPDNINTTLRIENSNYTGLGLESANAGAYIDMRDKYNLKEDGIDKTAANQFGTTGSVYASSGLDLPDSETIVNTNKQISDQLNESTRFDVATGNIDEAITNEDGTVSKRKKPIETIFKSWVKYDSDGKNPKEDLSKTFTPRTPYTSKLNDIIKNLEQDKNAKQATDLFSGSYKFFIEKLHDRTGTGKNNKKSPVKSSKGKTIPESLSNRMVFAAYIDNFYDDYSVDKSEYNFIGRGEGVPVYKATKRSMTLVFDIISDHSTEYMLALEMLQQKTNAKEPGLSEEILNKLTQSSTDWGLGYLGGLPTHTADAQRIGTLIPGFISDTPEGLWQKMTFLAQCCYAYYRSDGKMKEQPFVRIRIADFYDITGMISSLSFELNELEGVQIDMNPSSLGNIPLAVKVNMKIDIYHDFEPSSNFAGFYHRKEFDTNEMNKVTGKKVPKAQSKGPTDNTINHSPSQFIPKDVKEGLLTVPDGFDNYYKDLVTDVNSFKKNFKNLKSSAINLKDSIFKDKFKKSIEGYNKVNETTRKIAALRGDKDAFSINDVNSITGLQNISKGDAIKNKLKSIDGSFSKLKDNAELLYGNVASAIQKTKSQLNTINRTLNKYGIDVGKNKTIEQIAEGVNKINPATFLPKTFGDILDKLNK